VGCSINSVGSEADGCTGSGKTLPLHLSIALYDGGQSTILILPLLAMHDEYRYRARKHGLSCEAWTNGLRTPSAQIILVAVESCSWDELRHDVETLVRFGRLARIVVDEAHLLHKHASFRPCVDMLEYFGKMPTSILLMTATCPPNLEQDFFAKLGRKFYNVVRRSTDRPEIAQRMVPLTSRDMEKTVADNIKSITQGFHEQDRALLFCLSHDECDRMVKLLNWKPYHASIPIDERSRYMEMWRKGEIVGLVATSMLNCCLDYPTVHVVCHLGPPRDVVDYYQAIGRVARNGEPGQSIVYFDPTRLKKPTGDDPYGHLVIYDMLRDNSTCRRL
jgi:superfamily II DNA helicase RecQ